MKTELQQLLPQCGCYINWVANQVIEYQQQGLHEDTLTNVMYDWHVGHIRLDETYQLSINRLLGLPLEAEPDRSFYFVARLIGVMFDTGPIDDLEINSLNLNPDKVQ